MALRTDAGTLLGPGPMRSRFGGWKAAGIGICMDGEYSTDPMRTMILQRGLEEDKVIP